MKYPSVKDTIPELPRKLRWAYFWSPNRFPVVRSYGCNSLKHEYERFLRGEISRLELGKLDLDPMVEVVRVVRDQKTGKEYRLPSS